MKKIIGTNNDGKKFSVLTSRIFNKAKPEQAIKKPPTASRQKFSYQVNTTLPAK